jgi:hypothetical protein
MSGTRHVRRADDMWESYMLRTGGAEMYQREPAYRYQADLVRDLVRRLAVILEDEHVGEAAQERILRSVIYGSLSPADAEQRMRERDDAERLRLLAQTRRGPLRTG